MKSPGYAAIIVALGLLSGAAAEAESVLSVASRAQLLGSWAASCSAGASPSNWIVTWYAGGSGAVRRRSLRGPGLPPLDGAVDSAEMLSPTLMRARLRNDDPNWGDLNGAVYDVVLDMSDGNMRTISSVTGDVGPSSRTANWCPTAIPPSWRSIARNSDPPSARAQRSLVR